MANALDIAREIVRMPIHDGGAIVAELERMFPTITLSDILHACDVGRDQVEMWTQDWREDAEKAFELLATGASREQIHAAMKRFNSTVANLFPTKPDKSRS